MFFNIKYIIENESLKIGRGSNIDIKTIRKISETYNPLSSPAASIDQLEIMYNKYDTVLVSAKDKKGFINSLTEINPNIEVVYRKKLVKKRINQKILNQRMKYYR
ncbi:PH domain-containing protein [Flavobacterium sp. 1]|uniref:PH domain-containing protein n=1 Tax=Flavobacterium sp. 1 TaxID=2035200 RepID=UPI0012FDBF23|nr:PH domain-containing protein [Flavobacterium sp. 1]